jgi:phytoene dehydrogenase-like protein
MISCLLDFELVQKIEEAGHTKLFKFLMEDTIIQLFSNGIFEGLDQSVLFKFSTTPLSIMKITGNSEGSIVGWSFEKEAPVYSKLKELAKTVYTPIPNVYKASQWAYAPAGVPIAMLTAWQATQKIIKGK